MLLKLLLTLAGLISTSQTSGIQKLFPLNKEYAYHISSTIDVGVLEPLRTTMAWRTEGYLHVLAGEEFSRIRLKLVRIKNKACCVGGSHFSIGESEDSYSKPWEVEFSDGRITALYVPRDDPEWLVNFKRAVSLSMQFVLQDKHRYTVHEPSLLNNECETTYIKSGDKIVKYSSVSGLLNSTISVPNIHNTPLEVSTVERSYTFHEKTGLTEMQMKSTYRHTTQGHRLGMQAELSITEYYNTYYPNIPGFSERLQGLRKTSIQYVWDPKDPSNGLLPETQQELKIEAIQFLQNITNKDRNGTIISEEPCELHNMNFLNLFNTLIKLTLDSLKSLFEDLKGNDDGAPLKVFLEALPYVKSFEAVQLVKYLVVEKKDSIPQPSLLSLIRKLASTSVPLTQNQVEDLQFLMNLGPEYTKEVRHAGILSFASIGHAKVYKNQYLNKYLRNYHASTQYEDKLVWLQGLNNLQYSGFQNVYTDRAINFYERFWTLLAVNPSDAPPETVIDIIIEESEDIRLRIVAVHLLFSQATPKLSELMFVHNFMQNCKSRVLRKFWFSTITNLKNNKDFADYKEISQYLPYIQDDLHNAGPQYWPTFNYIQSTEDQGYSQLLSVQGISGLPAFVGLRGSFGGKLDSGEKQRYKLEAYLLIDGVASSVLRSVFSIDPQDMKVDELVQVLKRLGAYATITENVHIDLVVNIDDQTVLVSHIGHSKFNSWTTVLAFLEDFVSFGDINLQKVYVPFQHDITMVTELGTPLHLQTLIHSYASARGSLKVDTEKDWTLTSDLQLRYQSASITKLTGYGLGDMINFGRLQQVLVADLPLQFNLTASPGKGLDLKWSFEGPGRRPGLVMHSWAPVGIHTKDGGVMYITELNKNYRNVNFNKYGEVEYYFSSGIGYSKSVFFDDCDPPMAGGEPLAKLFASDSDYYDRLSSIQPSLSFLSSMLIFSSPSLGSCGFYLPFFSYNRWDETNHTIHLTFSTNQVHANENSRKMFLKMFLKYFSVDRRGSNSYDIDAVAMMETTNGYEHMQLTVQASKPDEDGSKKEWKIFIQEYNITHVAKDESYGVWTPKPMDGDISASYTGPEVLQNQKAAKKFSIEFDGIIRQYLISVYDWYGNYSKHMEFTTKEIGLTDLGILKMDELRPIQDEVKSCRPIDSWYSSEPKQCKETPLKITASIGGTFGSKISIYSNSYGTINVDNSALSFFDSWIYLPVVNSLGLYHQCRVYFQGDMKLQTLNQEYTRLYPYWCNETVLAADCTANPRFAVIRIKGGVVIYTGGYKLTLTSNFDTVLVDDSEAGNQFWYKASYKANVISWKTGIQVYYHPSDITVFIPNMYRSSVCGTCTDQTRYNNCPSPVEVKRNSNIVHY